MASNGASPSRCCATSSISDSIARRWRGSQDGDLETLTVQLPLNWYQPDRFEFRMQISRAEDATKVWVEYH